MDTVESVVSVHCVDVRQSLSQLGTLGSILREASYRPSSSITELLSSKYSAAWKNKQGVSFVLNTILQYNHGSILNSSFLHYRFQSNATAERF